MGPSVVCAFDIALRLDLSGPENSVLDAVGLLFLVEFDQLMFTTLSMVMPDVVNGVVANAEKEHRHLTHDEDRTRVYYAELGGIVLCTPVVINRLAMSSPWGLDLW